MRVNEAPSSHSRIGLAILIGLGVWWTSHGFAADAESATPTTTEASYAADLLIVLGASGTEEYGELFRRWGTNWEEAARLGECRTHRIGDGGDAADDLAKRGLQKFLSDAAAETERPLWIVMIGHGTYDGRTAKFNLAGVDVSDAELEQWLAPLSRPLAFINCSSASGTFIDALSKPNRVIITATQSGDEVNFARFGGALSQAIQSPTADLDKDGQVSLLEAFLSASRETEEFYTGANRLATEHALIDDNGDGQGTRADGFDGVRPVQAAQSGTLVDGYIAAQWRLIPSEIEKQFPPELRARRDELEREVFFLRDRKRDLSEEEYFDRLERLLVEIARLYDQAESPAADKSEPKPTDTKPPQAETSEAAAPDAPAKPSEDP